MENWNSNWKLERGTGKGNRKTGKRKGELENGHPNSLNWNWNWKAELGSGTGKLELKLKLELERGTGKLKLETGKGNGKGELENWKTRLELENGHMKSLNWNRNRKTGKRKGELRKGN